MLYNKLTLIILLLAGALLASCSSSGSSNDTPGLDGNLTIEVQAPVESAFFLTYYTWDGNEGNFNSETITIPQSGTFTYNVEDGNYIGFGIILGPIGDIAGVRLALLADGEVLEETTTPTAEGGYEIEVGSIPNELGAGMQ
ncbi:MAG: hypothetical protein LAT75_13125 [Candidatus Cyclonatronum sp.]|uniref:hypothetical protein n=1 Tax=Cyclonatronum sp. TaxID=3024185 RepID=UPI0025C56F0A|nr:hypothetical protein [Cyclonatronum sp.]MCC5934244.1 hypothetical protein [Balneolales bacterium]MCH8487805.1 hypothetical protein [Cyclonatronum sp.]